MMFKRTANQHGVDATFQYKHNYQKASQKLSINKALHHCSKMPRVKQLENQQN